MKDLPQRAIPSVDRLARELADTDLPRTLIVAIIRRELATVRTQGLHMSPPQITDRVQAALEDLKRTRITPVINGTGIIIHTNFGRSPLSEAAVRAITEIAANYSNLEFDLASGKRGSRAQYVEDALAILCGAPRATVVNNCAAALVLILRTLTTTARPAVVISRGELLQIGGGFRVPEILQASGATLKEIGTTNKTTLEDYERAIDEKAAMILRVHRSNFYMDGFVDSPGIEPLAGLAATRKIPLVVDLGSGALFDTVPLSNEHEPTPQEVINQGADLVCFSGDKLFAGPQAGIIAGTADLIDRLKTQPLFRALRCDKLVLAALQSTVDVHLGDHAKRDLPALAMMHIPIDQLQIRADRICAALGECIPTTISAGESQVGGGSLPRTVIPSVALNLRPRDGAVDDLANRLRRGAPPVVGHIADGLLKIDLRTVFPRQDQALIAAIQKACAHV